MGVLTVQEYRDYSEVQPSEIDDTTLQNLINWISSELEEIFHTKFGSAETITEYYNGENKPFLVLNKTGVVSVNSIEYHDGQNWVALSSTEYLFHPSGIVELIEHEASIDVFPEGHGRIRVNYTYGYTTVPLWVKNLAALMVDNRLQYDRNRDLRINAIIRNHYANRYYLV